MKNKIYIIENEFDGHHFYYLKNIIESYLKNDYSIELIIPDNETGDKIKNGVYGIFNTGIKISQKKLINVKLKNKYLKFIFNQICFLYFLHISFKNKKDEFINVFCPYIDSYYVSFSIFLFYKKRISFSFITMRQDFHFTYKKFNFKKLILELLNKSNKVSKIYIIDIILFEKYKNRFKKFKYFPDPILQPKPLDKVEARSKINLNKSTTILVYGYIDEKKSLVELFNIAYNFDSINILVAGIQNFDSVNKINNFKLKMPSRIKLFEFNEYINEDLENLLFSSADIIWLCYKNFSLMSNVLIKSIYYKKIIFYYDIGLIAYYSNKYGNNNFKYNFNTMNVKYTRFDKNDDLTKIHTWKYLQQNILN